MNDRDGVGAGREHLERVGAGDSADGHQGPPGPGPRAAKTLEPDLLAFDRSLKARGLNPGTSADLTVTTLFAASLQALEIGC